MIRARTLEAGGERLFVQLGPLDFVRNAILGDSRPETSSSPRRFFMVGRMPLDRLIARYDFDDFDCAAAVATSGAAIKPVVLLSQ
jgi:hypothetical protein